MGGVEARLHQDAAAVAEPDLNGPAGCRRRGASTTCTATNSSLPAWLSRFFQAKKCGAHSPRSRQNAATLSPLRFCSATIRRHFAHASRPRFCMPHCAAISPSTQDGVGVALTNGVLTRPKDSRPVLIQIWRRQVLVVSHAPLGRFRQTLLAVTFPRNAAVQSVAARISLILRGFVSCPRKPRKPHVRIRNECCGCGAGQTAHT